MNTNQTLTVGSAPFAIVPAEAFRDARLSLRDVQVLGLVCSHLNKDRICWPSQSRLAKMARVSRPTVCASLRRLEECGYIKMQLRLLANGGRSSNLIHVLFTQVAAEQVLEAADVPVPESEDMDVQTDGGGLAEPDTPVSSRHTGGVGSGLTPPVSSLPTLTGPIEQDQLNRVSSPPTPPRKLTPPPELDAEIWEQWEQHRKALRKPLTPQARALQWKKLAEWGWEHQRAIIERSIERGWQGLFPPDHEQNGKRESVLERVQRQTLAKHSHRAAVDAALTKLLGAGDGR